MSELPIHSEEPKTGREALEGQFRVLAHLVSDAIIVADARGIITYWNAAAEAMFGHSADEAVGESLTIMIPPRFREAHRKGLERFLSSGVSRVVGTTVELAGIRRDETEFPLELSLGAWRDGEDTIFMGIVRDITKRKEAADALRRSEASLRVLLDSLPAGVFASRDERFVYANRAGAKLFGLDSPAELLNRSTMDFVHPDDRGETRERLEATKRGEVAPVRERRLVKLDGSPVAADVTALQVTFEGLPTLLAVALDRSDYRQLQESLLLSDRMASIGTLAAGIAHEINNPLAAVMTSLDLIAEEIQNLAGASPSGRLRNLEETTNDARQGAERIRKIIRGLKTFSRASEERRVVLDVRAVLELSINLAFNEIRHRARLVKDYAAVPQVEADEARLAQVFINLLVNAAQAIPEGRVDRNEIRIAVKTDACGRANIEIRDTGSGMERDMLARIFDPFFTTKDVGVGAGLGLSICHSIVTGLGGELTVESEPGKGSVFRVVLPPSGPTPASVRPPPVRAEENKRGRVLIVDDDPNVGKSLRRVLASHDVVIARHGREALDLLRGGAQFDVILCDLMMPEMSGVELHAELSRVMPELVAKMIFVTGGVFTSVGKAFLDRVPNERLEKPFDMHNLRALVQRRLT